MPKKGIRLPATLWGANYKKVAGLSVRVITAKRFRRRVKRFGTIIERRGTVPLLFWDKAFWESVLAVVVKGVFGTRRKVGGGGGAEG